MNTHAMYDALQYVLFHPYASYGWHMNIFNTKGKKTTASEYYRYRLMIRAK